MKSEEIDAVITWVDGNDPVHQAKRARALAQIDGNKRLQLARNACDPTRFADCGERYYNIRLLRLNAPWIRHIHLITDNQRPHWLNTAEEKRLGVRIVSHEEIFEGYTACLPTFNSRSIETVMHRIVGLADRFLYLNDDILIVQPVREVDYFQGAKPVFRGWVRARKHRGLLGKALSKFRSPPRTNYPDESRHAGLIGIRLGQEEGRILSGQAHRLGLFHMPQPIVRSSFADIIEPRLERNICYPFRDNTQFTPVTLYANLLFQNQQCQVISPDLAYFAPDVDERLSQRIIWEKVSVAGVKHVCFQSLDEFDEASQDAARAYLEEVSPSAM